MNAWEATIVREEMKKCAYPVGLAMSETLCIEHIERGQAYVYQKKKVRFRAHTASGRRPAAYNKPGMEYR